LRVVIVLSSGGLADEDTGNLLFGDFFECNNDIFALSDLSWLEFLHLNLKVAALDLSNGLSLVLDKSGNLTLNLSPFSEGISIDNVSSIDYERPAESYIEALLSLDIINLVDAAKNHASQWHLLNEIIGGGVTQLIQACTYGTVVPNLNETSTFSNVGNVTDTEISLLECDICAILKYLVSLVTICLMFLIPLLEVN